MEMNIYSCKKIKVGDEIRLYTTDSEVLYVIIKVYSRNKCEWKVEVETVDGSLTHI